MNTRIVRMLALGISLMAAVAADGQVLVAGRKSVVLENSSARVVVDLLGGAIGEFRLKGQALNPLQWNTPREGDTGIHGFGHFLCLDRWGPPSDAEGARGMPYHGEAANVEWTLVRPPVAGGAIIDAQMTARLPKAGFSVTRTIQMSPKGSAFLVSEEVSNENGLGRMYNAVQHPTIGGTFLDESTLVDCNGRRGFAQGGSLPTPEEPSSYWPQALDADGATVNLRRLAADPNPNVVSFAVEEEYGWITAVTPSKGLLIGYIWKTRDYPWVSVWRDVRDGRPAARGLEFGTTGLHQPFPILAKKPEIWGRPTFQYLDAGQKVSRSYAAFLVNVPPDFEGVQSIHVGKGKLQLNERRANQPRALTAEGDWWNGE